MVTAIFKREFAGYFRTPLAYVVLAVFLVLASAACFFIGRFFDTDTASLEPFFTYLPWLFLFLVPAVGMRLWAEERRAGTIELLFTLPLTPIQAVLGKFLAGWLFLALAVALTFPLALTVGYLGSPDWGVVLGSYLGGILLAGACLAIASLMSALTRNQVIAFVLGFFVCLGFVLVGFSLFSDLLAGAGLPVPLVDAIGNFGFIPHYQSITRGLLDLRSLVYFLSLTGFALFLNVVALERRSGRKSLEILLLVSALVLVNYLASAAHLRFDLTAEKTYTLSAGTRSLVAKIEEPVTLQFYFSRSLKNLPVLFKNYATRVEELLRQYAAASGGKVKLVVTDPKPDTPEEEAATRARLTGQPLGDGSSVFLGLVATQADQQKSIAFLTPAREQFLEYDISKLLHSVQLFNKPKLGLLTSLPLRAPAFQMPGMPQPPQQGQVVAQEWEQGFDLVEVQPSATELPADLDALAVIHPEGLSEQLLFAIDQYVLAGKPLLLALDPSSRHFAAQGRQMQMYGGQPQNTSSDLPRLLAAWGVGYDSRKVVGDLEHAYLAQTQNGTASFPPWLLLGPDNSAADFLPISSVNDLLLLEAGAFTLNPPAGLEAKAVLESGTRSSLLDAMLLQFGGASEVAKQVKPDGSKQVLAALLRGTFPTAFPDGAPPAAEPADDGKSAGAKPAGTGPKPPALAKSAQPGTVFLVADTDWLLDEASLDPRYLRAGIAYPINGNLSFGTGLVDFLGGSRDLIGLRSKGTAQRPFEVVRRMQLAAQVEYQDRLDQLEGRLQAVQQRLSDLLQNQKDQTRLVATPEMQAEIENFRAEEARMRSERRSIRRALNEGIEKLQNTLIGLNLLAMPGAIAVAGIWFFRRRHRRVRL